MEEDPLQVARSAAEALSDAYGPQLTIEVEKRIAAGEEPEIRTYAVAEVVAIAAFLLSVAQFAYQIYKDQRDRRALDAEAMRRVIRIEVEAPPQLSAPKRDQVIEAVVDRLIEPPR